ncbi:MAG: protocatechuate 3,4-dioxygenase subunit alpha [Candidatus Parcubacteria bacterium]|nr:protocatechuate 3,4-dioxygenase subunit alpha [Burkholderiales bacterium]
MSLQATTSQTVGPYLHIGLNWLIIENLAPEGVPGERVSIEGRVVDGDGKPVNDALVEIWQANSEGRFGEKGFRGFGRSATDDRGMFRFLTIKPGRVPGPGGKLQAPHVAVNLFMRGQLKQLVSRIYFPDDANAGDAVLALVPAERRATLIARKSQAKSNAFEWNVILQGKDETVFFDC